MPNRHQTEAMLTLCAEIVRMSPTLPTYRAVRAVQDLQRVAARLHRRYEAACSYEWAATEAYERRTERLEADAASIAANLPGLTVEPQRDPRGWPLILKMNGVELGRLG